MDPLLFKIFVNDLFLLPKTCNITNYADDNTLYATWDCFEVIIEKLPADPISLQSWFNKNYIQKMLLYMPRRKSRNYWRILLPGNSIKKGWCQKLLGVTIDHKLNFEEHIKTICQTAGKKLNALTRLSPGWQKTGKRGSGASTKWRNVARIVILAAKNIIGEKIFVRKLISKMSGMKISTDT